MHRLSSAVSGWAYTEAMRRDALILTGAVVVAICVGIFAFLANGGNFANIFSSTASRDSVAYMVPFTKIAGGSQSSVDRRVNYFITSPSELSELWGMVNATGTPPSVDFSTHAVIAVFAGKEPSSSITVAKIEDANERIVSIAVTKPDGACSTNKAAASPYEIVAVSATSLPLTHTDLVTTTTCPK